MNEHMEWRNVWESGTGVIHTSRKWADLAAEDSGCCGERVGLQSRSPGEWEDVPLIDPKPGDCVTLTDEAGVWMVVRRDGRAPYVVVPVEGTARLYLDISDISAIVPHPQTGELR